MNHTLSFLKSPALAQDPALIAQRQGKTVPAYLKSRMVEALIFDLTAEAVIRYDFPAEKKTKQSMLGMRELSDELVLTIARFKFDAKRRRFLHKLLAANREGTLTSAQQEVFNAWVEREERFALIKVQALLEARRRGLKSASPLARTRVSPRSK